MPRIRSGRRSSILCFPLPSSQWSRDHKDLIIRAFASDIVGPLADDPDRALAQIRAHLKPEHGDEFTFYDSPLVERWRPARKDTSSRSEQAKHENDKPDLLFRVYMPSGRLYASETDKLVSLFRDWIGGARGRRIRQEGYQTRAGKVYEFYNEKGAEQIDLRQEFHQFSQFITLCDSDPSLASEQLLKAAINHAAGAEFVARFAKEFRRLRIDLKHERERRVLSIRQTLESDLLDQGIHLPPGDQFSALIEEFIPGRARDESSGAPEPSRAQQITTRL